VVGFGGVLAATYLASARTGTGADFTQVFNQGSTMFVDTFVMELVPSAMPFQHGETYVRAFAGIVPFSTAANQQMLMDWLVATHAPGSESGYGFSLAAEAYLNFGLVGILVVFAVLTVSHRYLLDRLDHNHFFPYASILFSVSWMYAFRGESATLLRTLAYGAALFVVLRLTSVRSTVSESLPWVASSGSPTRVKGE
jgi:hypothetical protein